MNELKLPNHVGIIMDGNGRWATKRGLNRSIGHKNGADNLKKLLKHIYKKKIKYVSIYAFSTENFKRSSDEVGYLMNLFIKLFTKESKIFNEEKIKVVFSGSKENLRKDVIEAMSSLEISTKDNENGTLNICLNYGSRQEITDAFKNIAKRIKHNEIDLEDISESLIDKFMYQELPPLDFVIRTSGELRTSNFMLWQSTYAEYYFPDTLFPDFNEFEFDKAIEEYNKRKRRFGGVNEDKNS